MRKKIVCAFIALTLISLGLTLIPSVFSQPENIKIVNYSYYFDQNGLLNVVGEVQNVGPNTIDAVILQGTILSSTGADLSDSATRVWVAYIVPQQKAPFIMEFSPPSDLGSWTPEDVSKIDLTVATANATSSYQYPDLTIISSSPTIGNSGDYSGAYLVNGVIQNTGSQTATNVTVVGTFYSSTGSVVAVGYTNYLTPTNLAPSGTMNFQIAALDLNQSQVPSSEKISSFQLLVQAELPILQGTAPIVTPDQGSGTTSSSSGSSGTSGTSSPSSTGVNLNNSNKPSNPATIFVVVIVVVILAIFGTVVALRRNKPHQTVKEARKARKNRG